MVEKVFAPEAHPPLAEEPQFSKDRDSGFGVRDLGLATTHPQQPAPGPQSFPRTANRVPQTASARQDLRTPPRSLPAEQAVLGAMLVEKEAIERALVMLVPANFYDALHQKIFQVIASLHSKNAEVSEVLVADALKNDMLFQRAGGMDYLARLVESTPSASLVESHARAVREKAQLRDLMKACDVIMGECAAEPMEVEALLDSAEQKIFNVTALRRRTGFVQVRDLVGDAVAAIEALYSRRDHVPGLSSGFVDLDKYTGGLRPGNLTVVGGRPSMGKTSLALNIAEHVMFHEKRSVAIFSLEMSRQELFLRLVCSRARVSCYAAQTGRLPKSAWPALTTAADEYKVSPAQIFIDDSADASIWDIKSRARKLLLEQDVGLIIVDYLQMISGKTGRPEYRQQEIADISRFMKGMAKDLNCAVMVMSQLSRAPERREKSRRPQLADLRESGAIEQDADIVILLYREEQYDREKVEARGKAEVIVAKNRNGPTGTLELTFLGEYTRFENPARPS